MCRKRFHRLYTHSRYRLQRKVNVPIPIDRSKEKREPRVSFVQHLRKLDPSSQMGQAFTGRNEKIENRFLIGAFTQREKTTVQQTVTISSCNNARRILCLHSLGKAVVGERSDNSFSNDISFELSAV